MAGVVGEKVQDDEVVLPSVEDVNLLVLLLRFGAEYTFVLLNVFYRGGVLLLREGAGGPRVLLAHVNFGSAAGYETTCKPRYSEVRDGILRFYPDLFAFGYHVIR